MLKVLIVDDEYNSCELLKILVESWCKDTLVIGTAGNVSESINIIASAAPDLLQLDVELGLEAGFDLLEQLPAADFKVILTTAYSHYALKAIKFSTIDYLLKPINPEEPKTAIDKAREQKNRDDYRKSLDVLLQNLQPSGSSQQKLALPTNEGLLFIEVNEIIYCQAEGAYTTIFTQDGGRILVSKHLKEYGTLLEGNNFFRVHHSYLVNLNQISRYVKGDGGYVVMSNKASIDVSRRRKEAFLAAITLR